MWCSRCVEWELRNYKTKNCEVIDYKWFAQCDEKSLNFVYLNCKNNKSINFSNWTKELNPENCIKELTPKITSQWYQIVRNTLPIIFSKSCDLRYHIEPNENKKLNWIVSATNELSKFKWKEDKIESEYIKNINSLLSNQLYALNYNNDIKNLSKKNQDYKWYLHKRLCELVNKDIWVLWYSYNEICPSSKNNNIKTIYNKTEVINIVEKNWTVKKTIIQK
jgi:hypothetical protein